MRFGDLTMLTSFPSRSSDVQARHRGFYDNSGPERAIEVARSQPGEGATTVVAPELWRYYMEVGDVPNP